MAKDKEIPEVLHTALNLDGSSESIKDFYADWAETYDTDTDGLGYTAVSHVIEILSNCPTAEALKVDPANPEIKIMDAGCGTGKLARALKHEGYNNIDGFDLSEDMVQIAESLGIYNQLHGNIDINAPLNPEWIDSYDCTVSIGVFTPGHVPPQALEQLQKMTRPGGLIIVSTRIEYYECEHYQLFNDKLESENKVQLLQVQNDATYTHDENAHYWVYACLD